MTCARAITIFARVVVGLSGSDIRLSPKVATHACRALDKTPNRARQCHQSLSHITLETPADASNPTVNNRTTEMINFMIVGSVSTKINVPIGTAITRPHSIGISVFKLDHEC